MDMEEGIFKLQCTSTSCRPFYTNLYDNLQMLGTSILTND